MNRTSPAKRARSGNAPKLFLEAFQGTCRVGVGHRASSAQERADAGKTFTSRSARQPRLARGGVVVDVLDRSRADDDLAWRSIRAVGTHRNVAQVVAKFPHGTQCFVGGFFRGSRA